ncbi:MAG: cob(I)yrinic acid a,c-diamide adenosyltransferase [Eubacteriales bacterium]|nr:cob(I)yrinic acid a,c-diamide adenosyltransferase [Eubacteriales bacterium]
MKRELTEVYCGNGRGKTTLAMGQSLRASALGKSVIIIQFLKGNERRELDFLEELDQLDIKIFRFERMEACYNDLSPQEQDEEKRNIINGLNFARKVVATQECDFLVLDEILGLLDKGIATPEMIGDILKQKDESMHIIMTGQRMTKSLLDYVDSVTTLNTTENPSAL